MDNIKETQNSTEELMSTAIDTDEILISIPVSEWNKMVEEVGGLDKIGLEVE